VKLLHGRRGVDKRKLGTIKETEHEVCGEKFQTYGEGGIKSQFPLQERCSSKDGDLGKRGRGVRKSQGRSFDNPETAPSTRDKIKKTSQGGEMRSLNKYRGRCDEEESRTNQPTFT